MNHPLALLALVSAVFTADLHATDNDARPMAGPLTSPWDANAWEPGSDRAFWRDGAEIPEASAPGKADSGCPAKARATSLLSQPAPKSDLSRRPVEK